MHHHRHHRPLCTLRFYERTNSVSMDDYTHNTRSPHTNPFFDHRRVDPANAVSGDGKFINVVVVVVVVYNTIIIMLCTRIICTYTSCITTL